MTHFLYGQLGLLTTKSIFSSWSLFAYFVLYNPKYYSNVFKVTLSSTKISLLLFNIVWIQIHNAKKHPIVVMVNLVLCKGSFVVTRTIAKHEKSFSILYEVLYGCMWNRVDQILFVKYRALWNPSTSWMNKSEIM